MPETRILPTTDPASIPAAVRVIHTGGLIAFPTDTIYGVAADPFNPEALLKVYEAKERPEDKALPVLIGSFEQLEPLVFSLSELVRKITAAFWPGPLTVVLPKGPGIPPELSPYPTLGIRMPNLDFTRQLLQATGPLATTSANISGGPNPVTAQDVLDQLNGRIDLLLDGGPTPGPAASTVVDATAPELSVLREGPIRLSDLQTLLDEE